MATSRNETPQLTLPEQDVKLVVRDVVKCTLPQPNEPWCLDFVVESIVVDVSDAGIPTTNQEVSSRYTELLRDYFEMVDESDIEDFCSRLSQRMLELQNQIHDEGGEDAGVGGCNMCEREMPLTKHHLIPKEHHKNMKKKGFSSQHLSQVVLVCRPCHSAIHRTFDNKELASTYNTPEKLQQVEALQKFAAWARKQRVPSYPKGQHMLDNSSFRYKR